MIIFQGLLLLLSGSILPTLALPFEKRSPQAVPNKYIVTLKPGVSTSSVNTHLHWVDAVHKRSLARRGASDTTGVDQVFNIKDFNAYAGSFDSETIKEIEASEDVATIEPDMVWHLLDTPNNPYFHTGPRPRLTTQPNAPWGLGSISHRLPNSTDYIYDTAGAGEGFFAYLIDTGVRSSHVELEGRVINGFNAFPDSDFTDNYGHGTHTAGTIASKTYGVAKKATVVSVKVFDWGGSSTSIVLSGFTWAVNNITSSSLQARSVISMSLGGPLSEAFNAAVSEAYNLGVLSIVAAGNDGIDAREVSPASAPQAITVGAIDVFNTRPYWSNYGEAVDIFAPGVDVLSCWNDDDESAVLLEGTSMATPHVSGLVLYLRALDEKTGLGRVRAVEDVVKVVKSWGTQGVVLDGGEGSPNLLAYNGNGA
ncbi:subtilisin-like proteinase Mp1 [Naviculisporaceae sp. PSN 640]